MTGNSGSSFLAALDRLHERFLVGVDGVTEVWLIRHGDAYAELVSLDDSRIDPPLSGKGRREAALLGERLSRSGVEGLWSSQLERARETATIAGAPLGLVPSVDDRLREVRTHWDGNTAPPTEEVDGGTRYIPFVEPFSEVIERMEAAVTDIAAAAGPGGRVAAVTHAGAISVYVSHLLGLLSGGNDDRMMRMLVQFTSVSVVLVKDDHRIVQSIGDISHLVREDVPAGHQL